MGFDARDPEQAERVERAAAAIMHACIRAGGTVTGEHGVGADKIRYLPLVFDSHTLGAMRDVQRVFDPLRIANPGKVLPVGRIPESPASETRAS
jgi:FAD/FMN-containing dehydrogenase